MLDYDGFAVGVKGLGPGRRVVLWVRGCGIGCKGCMTKELWTKGEPRPIAMLAEQLRPVLESSDGLTISGGEPFDQAAPLAELIDELRAFGRLHVLCYSGYRLERIRTMPKGPALLDRLDILIDGPYVDSLPTDKLWRGSDNQRLHRLSGASWQEGSADWRELQLQPLADGSVRLIGIPRRGDLPKLRAALRDKGLTLRSES